MEDRIPYKGCHVLLSRREHRWVAEIVLWGQSSASFVIHGATMAVAVNAAFGIIDASEHEAKSP
jgi:hypothetical protein